jgi:hypothetical protein
MATLVTLAPADRAEKLIPLGWSSGRSNGYTVTLSRKFKDLDQAVRAGRTLPIGWVWSIEDVIRT